MICPNCGDELRERERSGIEIDICPQCRGVWLDRGELDKIIARETRYYDEDDDWDDDDDWRREGARSGERGRREWGERGPGRDRREEYRDRPQKKKGFFQTLLENFGEGGEAGD
jgi:Zn-finger nucleic acid-binding protein